MSAAAEQEALLAAVFAAPEDDTARLVYADWLQENGEEEYAEFIRAQVALTAVRPGARGRPLLRRRERAAWRAFERRWRDRLAGLRAGQWRWHNGFPSGTVGGGLTVSPETFVARSAGWWPWLPFRFLSFQTTTQFPPELPDCGHLRRVVKLYLWKYEADGQTLAEEFVVRLFRAPLDRLTDLHINAVPLTRRVVEAVRAAAFLPRLGEFKFDFHGARGPGWFCFPELPRFNDKTRPRLPGEAVPFVTARLDELEDHVAPSYPATTSREALVAPAGATRT